MSIRQKRVEWRRDINHLTAQEKWKQILNKMMMIMKMSYFVKFVNIFCSFISYKGSIHNPFIPSSSSSNILLSKKKSEILYKSMV